MMSTERRNYRKVYSRLWKSPEFREMGDSLKILTLYVLTGPQSNRVGLYHFSFAQAAEDLGASTKVETVLRARLMAVCETFGWSFDARASVIWIPSWWIFNPVSEKTKNLQGYLTDLGDVPRTSLISKFCNNLDDIPIVLRPLFDPWLPALTPVRQGPNKARTRPEQGTPQGPNKAPHMAPTRPEQGPNKARTTETETETETNTTAADETPPVSKPKTPTREAFEHYHVRFGKRYNGAKPSYAGDKDGGRMARLLKAASLDEVKLRFDAYFDSHDPFLQSSGHTLDLFFDSGVQTKLIATIADAAQARTTARVPSAQATSLYLARKFAMDGS